MRTFASRTLSLALVSSVSAVAAGQSASRNIEPAFADTRAALMAGDADIICIGDSLTYRPGGMHGALRTLMHDAYGDGGAGYQAFSVWTGAGVNPGWDRGLINADVPPHHSLDGMWISWNGTGSTSAFLDAWSPISKVHYLRGPGTGNLLVTHSGGSNFILTAAPEQRVAELTLAHTTTPRAWYYPSGGPVTLLGQNNLSGTPGARVHRAANGGWGVNNFLRRDWTFDEQLRLLTPDLIIIMLGQNDQGFSMVAYRTALDALVVRLQTATPDAEIVLVSSYDSGSPALANLSIAMEDVALTRNLGFINLYAFGGTYPEHLAAGRIDPDGVHFTPVGGAYVADFIFDALHTAGRSIDLPCDTIDFNLNNVYPEEQDVIDFFNVLAGGDCLGCNDIDFNNNNVFPEDQDVIDFFNVLAGGTC